MLAQAQLQFYLLTFVKCSVHVSDCVTINVRTDVCIGVSTHSKLVDAGMCEKTAYGQMLILTHLSCKKTVLQQLSLVVRQSYYRDIFISRVNFDIWINLRMNIYIQHYS